nr:hemolysin III family protein [uncultured Desulfobacter sp.]
MDRLRKRCFTLHLFPCCPIAERRLQTSFLNASSCNFLYPAAVYSLKRPIPFPRILGFHEIWHCFVILGSASHFRLSFKFLM